MSSHDSSSEIDQVELTPEQARALEQLLELTDGADIDVAKGVLGSVDWNVERAAELIFGQHPINMGSSREPTVTQSQSTFQTFDVDDSAQGLGDETEGLLGRNAAPERPQPVGVTILRPLFSIISVPFNILFSVFRFIFSVLRIPFPFSSTLGPLRFSSLNFYRPLSGGGSGGQRRRRGPDAWIRELEEETGAVSIALEGGNRPRASGVSLDPSESSISARPGAAPSQAAGSSGAAGGDDAPTKFLPDFVVCTYEEMLRRCQTEFRIGCVVLVSEEHDDVPEFKRSTLTDYPFVKALHDNNIIVWGGDVRDREAWSAAEKLQATTYPFVAFVALQARRSPSSTSLNNSNAPTQLTVLSRHQGPSRPFTPTSYAPTSAATLLAHLEDQLLPRVSPFLNRLIHAQEQRAYDRRVREQQDRAYEETAKRDKERILKSMEEARSKKEREERERLEAERRRKEEEERVHKEKEEREARERVRGDVRSWMAKHVVPGATSAQGGKVSRFAMRMPDGSRVLQSLSDETSLTGLFAIVDVALGGKGASSDEPVVVDCLPADGSNAESNLEAYILRMPSESVEQSFWHFRLATAYPRVEVLWKAGAKLRDIEALKGGGQIVVEKISVVHSNGNGKGKASDDDDDDDGYRTEESE